MIRNVVTAGELRKIAKRKGRKGTPWYRRAPKGERTVDGITFASKAEASYYEKLKREQRAGRVAWFVRQPILDLAGVIYRPDFLIAYPVDSKLYHFQVVAHEVQGKRAHPEKERRWRRNAKQVENLYGFPVILISEGT